MGSIQGLTRRGQTWDKVADGLPEMVASVTSRLLFTCSMQNN